ncbi:hypothetical protein FOG51_02656 [Hanseniaspora uvarum]|uniref:Uncharacterized protein n=1 Tax=Hanseniaspora uvarum TaxID=29833 RepID=A0A1E5RD69_HANUV|nr:hypothetical protein FOG48_02716 [Hanseniaspora uvarum]KAF0272502.1 hypothetical protein FOG51_02656 [Hanseniaspora uvarum]KAF0277924.1 hypothetical protein FOG50_01292 [Hanseniaspora uvarum]OEJ84831.1 hypothetical protein AWRI3580_g3478 [Hanseniaspora uvarum]GMM41155.1 hypothetical protein DAHU10_020560 [Hanseniaspora uvarum]
MNRIFYPKKILSASSNYVSVEKKVTSDMIKEASNINNKVQLLKSYNQYTADKIGSLLTIKGTVVQNKLLPYGVVKVITSPEDIDYILLSKYNELEKKRAKENEIKNMNLARIKAETEARIKAEQLAEAEEFEAKL